MKNRLVVVLALVCFSFSLIAQKIKYKDLFPILEAKNYEEGKPQLLLYLSDEKNQEEANPNLQMALMLEHYFLQYDIIDDSSTVYTSGDSAVFFFEKAKSLIDEKELRKKDEYYQAFFRRDLRTGEFGIKVSDVHLDIEKKIEAINKRISDVKSINQSLNKIEAKYSQAMDKYKALADTYENYNSLLLAVSDDEMEELSEIQSLASEAISEAESIQAIAKELKSEKYQDKVELKPIENFGKDGMEGGDIKSGAISLWDYESWARETLSEIRGSIGLFKTQVTNYSKEIREKKSKLRRIQHVEDPEIPGELLKTFDKYDPESTVEILLKMETYEVGVIKNVDLQLNPDLLDSAKIGTQLKFYTEAKENVDSLYSLVNSITSEGLANAKKKYPEYIGGFFGLYGTASKYVEDMKEWSARNKNWITNSVEFWTEKNKWGSIHEVGIAERKLPLFMTDSLYGDFKILRVNKFTVPQVVVCGVDLTNDKGYIGSFGDDRVEQWSLNFDIPTSEGLSVELDTIPSAEGTTSLYLYDETVEENNLSAICYTDSGTKVWAVNTTVSKKPVEFKFDDLTQELTILMYPEEKLPLDSDDLGYIVIDRTGNVR